jgi:quercetin dioxygenase-like cupin family protein
MFLTLIPKTMKICSALALIGLALSSIVPASLAQDTMKTVKLDEIVWQPHAFLKGCYTYTAMGDPTKAVTTVRIDKLPPHLKIPAHTHPYSEMITVLRGTYWNAMGDDAEAAAAAQGVELKPGSSFVLPAGHVHHTWTGDEETILQVTFVGPVSITFVNPADDPRKKP